MRKTLHQLVWNVKSPSRYEHVGDNRAVVYKGKARGWAILVDGQVNGAYFETRDEAMRVLCYAFTLYKLRKADFDPAFTGAGCLAIAADIMGPDWKAMGERARDKYRRFA